MQFFSLFDNAVKIRQNADVPVAYFCPEELILPQYLKVHQNHLKKF